MTNPVQHWSTSSEAKDAPVYYLPVSSRPYLIQTPGGFVSVRVVGVGATADPPPGPKPKVPAPLATTRAQLARVKARPRAQK